MWRVTLRGLAAKKFRLILTSISIVLGVAFMAGTFVLTDTLGGVFDGLFAKTTKGVDVVVRSRLPYEASGPGSNQRDTRPPVPASVVDTVGGIPGVEGVQGNLLGYALVIGTDGKEVGTQAPTFGLPWYPARTSVNQSLAILKGRQARTASEVTLDYQTFVKGGFSVGDRVRISFLTVPPREFTLTGVFSFGGSKEGLAGATLAAFTPATAQEVMNRVGQWDLVEARAAQGITETELRDRVRRSFAAEGLDARYQVITGEQLAKQQASQIQKNLSFFNTFLLIFALVALFVGAFVIYNTFSITVAQRIREIGLLRALGASGRQVNGSILGEAFVVGLLSSVLGVALGIAIVRPLEALLSAFGIDLPGGSLQIVPRTIIVSFVVGIGVTMVSSFAPARRASRVPPIAALRDQAFDASSGRRRYVWGTVMMIVAAGALALGLLGRSSGGNSAVLVGVSLAFAFIGVSMLSPLLARPAARLLTWPSRRTGSISGTLAEANASRNPRRTASTAAALMIGLTLVTAVAVLSASFKETFSSAVRDQTTADFILSPKGFQPFSPAAAQLVREQVPGSTVVEYRPGSIQIAGESTEVIGASPDFTKMTDVHLRPGARRAAFAEGGLYVYKNVAKDKGYQVGDRLDVTFPDGPSTLTVQGIFDNNRALPFGGEYVVSLADWGHFPNPADIYAGVLLAPGTSTQRAERTINRIVTTVGGVQADNKAGYIDRQLAQFNQILGLMYVLLMLAVIIALVGIVNTLALSVYERTREIGLLRAVGMSRAQLRRMIRGEALVVAIFGSILGLVIGLVFAYLIVAALQSQGITFAVPVAQLVIFMLLAALAGLVAGAPPARRAARLDILQAINTD